MDPRPRKLQLALWIMVLGTLLAWIWHGYQGWGLGHGYPDNTYLYIHYSAFTDWTGVVQLSALPTPYAHEFAFYFPATYIMFKPFVWMDTAVARDVWPDSSPSLILYLATVVIGTILMQRHVLADFIADPVKRLLAAMALTVCSYPVIFCFDRGNVELGMALLVGAALLYCRHVRYWPAALLMSVPVLLKLYPILLFALFIRRRHLRFLVVPTLGCVALSVLATLTFSQSIPECLALWHRNMTQYNFLYTIADRGLSGGASPWNALKAALLSADHFRLIDLHLIHSGGDRWSEIFLPLATIYNYLFLCLMFALVLFATFVEREFFRRALFFLLFMTICAQAGADYKLLWVHVALIVMILLRTARRLDLAAVVLMALVLVPKKEIYLTYLGATDTTFNDVSFGVIANPLLIFAVIVLLLADSWRNRVPGWTVQRYKSLAHQLMDWTPWRGKWRTARSVINPTTAPSS